MCFSTTFLKKILLLKLQKVLIGACFIDIHLSINGSNRCLTQLIDSYVVQLIFAGLVITIGEKIVRCLPLIKE